MRLLAHGPESGVDGWAVRVNAAGLCALFVALDPSELVQADLDGLIGFVRARDFHGGAIEYLLFAPCLVLCELVWVLVPMNPLSCAAGHEQGQDETGQKA